MQMRADEGALTSFTVCDAYRYFMGKPLLMTSHSRLRTKIDYQRIILQCLTDTLI